MVLNKLRDESTQKIGIWGMGGAGKTTTLDLLNNYPDVKTIFDFVIWVTVSKSWTIRKLQNEVRMRLSIAINADEPNDRVASKLLKGLEGKKYLLLLDDVWDEVDLSVEGFPNANQQNAWEMFSCGVGHVAMLSTIKPYAQEIVTECGGLPLALKVVCGALRKEKNVNVWRIFLRKLRSPATSVIEDLSENVFKVLKVSYEGKLTLEQALDEGEAILQALMDESLSEKCDKDDSVKMHDVVRDMVLAITSLQREEPTHLVRAGISSEMIPEEVEWKNATRISFMNRDLRSLPESPNCPKLQTLLLQGNKNLKALPKEISALKDLEVLYVGRSKLEIGRRGMKSIELIIPVGMICGIPHIESILCLEMEEGQSSSPPPPLLNVNSFTNLTRLSVWNCPLIEHLFSSGFMLQQMSNLKDLIVSRCWGLKGMIPEDEKVEYEALPKLSFLHLYRLPEFVNLFEGDVGDFLDVVKHEIKINREVDWDSPPKFDEYPNEADDVLHLVDVTRDDNGVRMV
ncbi:hypothetical protein RHSIM_Rhsim12G0033800 [Rhododendron simsii]|uniref:NB-ARC domain-containing protein n=1 Tax=Rhododendron simsii TaxID=118357 RepID=A0A834G250_RHOSS|nr:hypothetical protein RHSIM_Rhsim12G0033800 [Rhododendron simsii]